MKRALATANAERATGTRRVDSREIAPKLWRPDILFGNPMTVAERWGHAVGRIQRILREGKDGTRFVGACSSLAYEYETLWACFQARNIPARIRGYERNAFDGLSDRDAARAFMRGVEDICDRSTGVLGSWYTR